LFHIYNMYTYMYMYANNKHTVLTNTHTHTRRETYRETHRQPVITGVQAGVKTTAPRRPACTATDTANRDTKNTGMERGVKTRVKTPTPPAMARRGENHLRFAGAPPVIKVCKQCIGVKTGMEASVNRSVKTGVKAGVKASVFCTGVKAVVGRVGR